MTRLECNENFTRDEDFTDMFPENDYCCAWTKGKSLYNFDIFLYKDVWSNKKRRACNIDGTYGVEAGHETCCQSMTKNRDCGEGYYPAGPAYEDVMEFARDEDIWIHKFKEAWHLATENGSTELNWLIGQEFGEKRHDLDAKQSFNCRGLNWDQCQAADECWNATVQRGKGERQHWLKACRNRHRLVSD